MADLRGLAYDHPDATALRMAQWRELVLRYADVEATGADPGDPPIYDAAEFAPPSGWFVVAYEDGRPVACGGYRAIPPGYHPGGDGRTLHVAEVKRMFVVPGTRGQGLSRLVLAALEQHAASTGYRWMWLETGLRQPEAIELYESQGYVLAPSYGEYHMEPLSRCYAKRLG